MRKSGDAFLSPCARAQCGGRMAGRRVVASGVGHMTEPMTLPANLGYVEDLYRAFLRDPATCSISEGRRPPAPVDTWRRHGAVDPARGLRSSP
jgi:hypothetical protein